MSKKPRMTNAHRVLKASLAGLIGVAAISCIPQTFHTADIAPGESHVTVGAGATAYDFDIAGLGGVTNFEGPGVGLEVSGRHDIGERGRHAVIWGVGGLVSKEGPGNLIISTDPELILAPYAAAGIQFEFFEKPSSAVQFGLEFPSMVFLAFLMGFDWPGTDREIVTIGVRNVITAPAAFIAVHPLRRLHLSVGMIPIGGLSDMPIQACIGFTFGKLGNELNVDQP